MIQQTDLYIRTCQECGTKQESKPCIEYKGDSWRDKLCKHCKSSGLDYGSFGWYREGNIFKCTADDSDGEIE